MDVVIIIIVLLTQTSTNNKKNNKENPNLTHNKYTKWSENNCPRGTGDTQNLTPVGEMTRKRRTPRQKLRKYGDWTGEVSVWLDGEEEVVGWWVVLPALWWWTLLTILPSPWWSNYQLFTRQF